MGRAPCCEKMGLKKGPWTREEDQILINYINQNGHGNWRALPKLAGLLRCGKSCRLRWMNYLRPDIKRGNFTREEEDAIIRLHQEFGNRWSVIAARLPGRTDNEIKNVWHTHLKKRLNKNYQSSSESKMHAIDHSSLDEDKKSEPNSPLHLSGEISSSSSTITAAAAASPDNLLEMDESFWTEVFSGDDSSVTSDVSAANSGPQLQIPLDVIETSYSFDLILQNNMETSHGFGSDKDDNMDFWHEFFTRAGELVELPEL